MVWAGMCDFDEIKTDILVIGAGSAGFGAALAALRMSNGDTDVTVIDKNDGFGGTSVFGGVNCWEPGVAGPGLHLFLAASLLGEEGAAGVGKTVWSPTPEKPWGLSEICADGYDTTLRRSGLMPEAWRRFQFEPGAMRSQMEKSVRAAGRPKLLFGAQMHKVEMCGSAIRAVWADDMRSGRHYRIAPRVVIDATADIAVARAAGCDYACGEDARADYGESSAPENPSGEVNAVTLVFRVAPAPSSCVEDLPDDACEEDAWPPASGYPVACFNRYPDGSINVNMLPTMEGAEYLRLGGTRALEICRARVLRYWRFLQTEKGMACYRLVRIFPEVGVRESYRLRGRKVLTELDIRAGLTRRQDLSQAVAFADHALDTHGRSSACRELREPYGIPFGCLLPKETENLLVACRGASFSHIAASSCRLSRTMIALGEAAGASAALCLASRHLAAETDVARLRDALGIPAFEEALAARPALD